jgi:hypothetical protein
MNLNFVRARPCTEIIEEVRRDGDAVILRYGDWEKRIAPSQVTGGVRFEAEGSLEFTVDEGKMSECWVRVALPSYLYEISDPEFSGCVIPAMLILLSLGTYCVHALL